jgi:hypothetical protein
MKNIDHLIEKKAKELIRTQRIRHSKVDLL